jgi:hypothetical protein
MSLDFLMIKFHFLFNDIEITIQSKKLPMQSRLLTWRPEIELIVVEVLYTLISLQPCKFTLL